MDLQGIGALAAAGVALIAALTTVLVGRWQTRAVLRASAHSARVGRAQAAASYKAALDAVQAQGRNEHLQWKRGIQRDAYATFLQSVLDYMEHATNVFAQGTTDPSQVPAVITASKPLGTDMSHRNLVVKLEGPEEASAAAQSTLVAAERFMQTCQGQARWFLAQSLLRERTASHPQEARRIQELLGRAEGYSSTLGTDRVPAGVVEELQELRALFSAVGLGLEHLAALTNAPPLNTYSDKANALDDAIENFLRMARAALHSAVQPAPNT
ncbi:hypothetical protein [Streptomyces hirsutus]|uniref:hypothetical protein n=1 Tax=Streptomyces hirsutus TaxID=35620 RepID=UPI0036641111